MAILLVSVAPDVKTISLASALMRSATCYDLTVKSAKGVVKTIYRMYLSSIFDGLFSFPSIRMSPTVRVAIEVSKVWKHGVKNPGVNRCCSLESKSTRRPPGRRMDALTCMSRYMGRIFSFTEPSRRGISNLNPSISVDNQ